MPTPALAPAIPAIQVDGAPSSFPSTYSSGYSPTFHTRLSSSCAMKASSDSCSSPLSRSRSKTMMLRTPSIVLVRSVTVVTMSCWWVTFCSSTTDPDMTKLVPGTSGNHLLSTRARCGKSFALKTAVGVQSAGTVTVIGVWPSPSWPFDSSPSLAPALPAAHNIRGATSASSVASRMQFRDVISVPVGEGKTWWWIGRGFVAFGRGLRPSLASALPEAQVKGWHDEQVEQGRRQQPAENDNRQRILDLMAGSVPEHNQWHHRQPGRQR